MKIGDFKIENLNFKDIKTKAKRIIKKHRSVTLAAFAFVLAVAMFISFVTVDSRLRMTMNSKAASISVGSTSTEVKEDGTRELTVTATITEDSEKTEDEIKNGISALFVYQKNGASNEISATSITVERILDAGSASNPSPSPDPADLTEPTEPAESTDPTEPTEPTKTTESTELTDSTDPTEPTKPTEPTEPTKPTESTESTESTDPTEPTKPTEPTEPTKPTEPTGGNNTDPEAVENTVYQYKVTVVFSIPNDVKSGTYTIKYGEQTTSGEVTLSAEPSIASISIDGAAKDGDTYYLQSAESKTLKVSVNNSAAGYTLKLLKGTTVQKSVNLQANRSDYSFTNVSLADGNKFTISVYKGTTEICSKEITIKVGQTSISITKISDGDHESNLTASIFYTAKNKVTFTVKVTNPVPGYKVYVGGSLANQSSSDSSKWEKEYSIVEENVAESVTIEIKKDDGTSLEPTFVKVFRDTVSPTVEINGVYTATDRNGIYSHSSTKISSWTNQKLLAVVFTVSDAGAGLKTGLQIDKNTVTANGTAPDKISSSNNQYTAYFSFENDTDEIKLTVSNLEDAVGNTADNSEVSTGVGIDTVNPRFIDIRIQKAENGEFKDFSNFQTSKKLTRGKYRIKLSVSDDRSGIEDNNSRPNIEIKIGTSSYSVTKKDGCYYSGEWNINKKEKSVNISITVMDNAGNSIDSSKDYKVNSEPTINSISVEVREGDKVKNAAKIGDQIIYTLKLADEDEEDLENLSVTSFVLKVGSKKISLIDNNQSIQAENGEVTVSYTIPKKSTEEAPTENDFADCSMISVDKITLYDGHQDATPNFECQEIEYQDPISIDNYTVTITISSDNSNNKQSAINGSKLIFAATATPKNGNHQANVEPIKLTYSIDDDELENPIPEGGNYSDMAKISVKGTYRIVDDAGNVATCSENQTNPDDPENPVIVQKNSVDFEEPDTGVTYYAPISSDNVSIICKSSNEKSNLYAKEGDTLTVKANVKEPLSKDHKLYVTVNKVNGDEVKAEDKEQEIDLSFTTDVAVTVTATVTDDAGQSVDFNNEPSGITYYADITLTGVSFTSNARYNNFARKGSNITFEAKTSHEVSINKDDVVLQSKNNDSWKASSAAYDSEIGLRIIFENIYFNTNEEYLTPSFMLTDVAGNELSFPNSQYTINAIEYDSVNPTVGIKPKLNGFLNGNFSCTATFSDKNLYAKGMSFEYHAKKTNTTRSVMDTSDFKEDNTADVQTFEQTLTLTEEDTYKISASVTDKAGNTSADAGMTVTIDKTAPNITSAKITADTILIFKKGFVISDYVDIEEEFINELICKLSDSTGTVDWDVDKPIETEGKKTISIAVTDMAGNTASYDFEVYIDATAPAPVVKDTVTGREMEAGKENKFTKELDLSVLLETPQIPNMLQDEFTTLKLLDADGNEIYDFISKDGLKTDYVYNFTDYGKYVLLVEAKDHAIAKDGNDGNVYGPAKYYITFTDGNIFEVIGDNPILMYSLISLLALALIGGGIFAFIVLAKRKRDKENA